MSTARIAKSLDVLRHQVDAAAPGRDKSSDGWLGDAAHAARKSEHNPDANGVVRALDITHDPAHGVDSYALADLLRQNKDPRILYLISNRRIASSVVEPWTWRPYTGSNPHDHHMHVSVVEDPAKYDATDPWALEFAAPVADAPSRAQKGITATVFGGSADRNESAYDNHVITDDEFGVALPSRFKSARPDVRVTNPATGKSAVARIVDVGPWNIDDPYWEHGARPEAETGTDIRGRKTNRAGIDLTPAAARAIGLDGKGLVDWEFVTAAAPAPQPIPIPTPQPVPTPIPQPIPQPVPIPAPAPQPLSLSDLDQVARAVMQDLLSIRQITSSALGALTGQQSPAAPAATAKEAPMSMSSVAPAPGDLVRVEVKPAWQSKINWAQLLSLGATVLTLVTGGKFNLSPETQVTILGVIGTITPVITAIFRTFFNSTVTPSSVAK